MAKIFLSPSNQTDNRYAWGNTTEAEQCGRIAHACKAALERNGQEVMLMHDESIQQKVPKANAWGADYYIPIHTNAFNHQVSGTRMFYGGDVGHAMCISIFERLAPLTPGTSENIKHNPNLMEVRMPKAATAYIEVDFHDVPETAKWLIEHTVEIGETIAHGICDGLGVAFVEPGVTPEPAPEKAPEKPQEAPEKKQYYRVRRSWKDVGSQTGAFLSLENAKKGCGNGFFVFREDGKPIFYRVAKNDSLWVISKKAYGDGRKYQPIMDANRLQTSTIYPGQGLEIPVLV